MSELKLLFARGLSSKGGAVHGIDDSDGFAPLCQLRTLEGDLSGSLSQLRYNDGDYRGRNE